MTAEDTDDSRTTKRKKNSDKPADNEIQASWSEAGENLEIILEFGGGVTSKDDLDFEITDQDCQLKIADGREWGCTFYCDVNSTSTKVSLCLDRSCLKISVKKRRPINKWPTLESSADTALLFNGQTGSNTTGSVAHSAANEHSLMHVKNDWYDKNTSFVSVIVYIKGIDKESLNVLFEEEKLVIKFMTSDQNFLKLNSPSSKETIFSWTLHLRNRILPGGCHYVLRSTSIEITLRKKTEGKWIVLEALAGLDKISSGRQPTDWVPVNSSPSPSPSPSPLGSGQPLPSAGLATSDSDEDNSGVSATPSANKLTGGSGALLDNNSANKPTCLVLPLTSKGLDPDMVVMPGYTGLDNLGNTCFMNSVLQMLANTREFRNYFLGGYFKDDLNMSNPLGTGGKLAVSFSVLLKSLWSGKNYSCAPTKLKSIIAGKASQFTGFAQHDTQEFLAFFLDGLHEDLNRVKDKPYTESVEIDGRSDEEMANEAWKIYKERNDSFIVDLFQGQYKSKLVCPECQKVSITFDPFMHLSVPLPKERKPLVIFFFSKECLKKPSKHILILPENATMAELKENFIEKADSSSFQADNLRVFVVLKGKIAKIPSDPNESIFSFHSGGQILISEVLPHEFNGEPNVEIGVIQRTITPHSSIERCSYCSAPAGSSSKLKKCTRCHRAAYCDHECQKNHWTSHRINCKMQPEPIGVPFFLSLPQSQCTFSRLCQVLESYSRYSVNIFQPPANMDCSSPLDSPLPSLGTETSPLSMGAASPSPSRPSPPSSSASNNQENLESMSPDNSSRDENGNPPSSPPTPTTPRTAVVVGQMQFADRGHPPFFIKPVDQWGVGLTGAMSERLSDKGETPLDLKRYKFLAIDWQNSEKASNHVMIEAKVLEYDEDESVHTVNEELAKDTTLEQCLKLFTEPEKLAPEEAWYCGQCKEHREASKQLLLWRLPSTLTIQLKRFQFRHSWAWRDKIDKHVQFPLRHLDLTPYCSPNHPAESPPIYDLYGVVNHMGGMLGGHYTAHGRLPSAEHFDANEVDWRVFDDRHVSDMSEKDVVTSAAYLLFYRRREAAAQQPPWPLSAGQSEESMEAVELPGAAQDLSPAHLQHLARLSPSQLRAQLDRIQQTQPPQPQQAPANHHHHAQAVSENNVYNLSTFNSSLGYTNMDDVD